MVFGSDVQPNQIVDMARRYPMMAERQVVIVKEAQNIKNWERLERYVEKPMTTTVLVLCHKNGSIDGRKKILPKAAAVGVVFESKKKREYELPSFIENYLKLNGQATIDNKAAQMIADHIGADLSRLTGELDKLLLSLSDNDRRITPDIVETRIGVSKDFNAYELRSAIVNRDVLKANRILNYFNSNPYSYPARFAEELARLGARIHTEGRVAVVTGVEALHGAPAVATDLRGGAALIIAALSAEGETDILDSGHIERGYERFDANLRALGADITLIDTKGP